MSRVENVIAGLCPKGVEFQAIGNVGERVRGNGLPKPEREFRGFETHPLRRRVRPDAAA